MNKNEKLEYLIEYCNKRIRGLYHFSTEKDKNLYVEGMKKAFNEVINEIYELKEGENNEYNI